LFVESLVTRVHGWTMRVRKRQPLFIRKKEKITATYYFYYYNATATHEFVSWSPWLRCCLHLFAIAALNNIIEYIMNSSLVGEQLRKEVLIWLISEHLLIRRHPTFREIETSLLEVKL